MKTRGIGSTLALIAAMAISPVLYAQNGNSPASAGSAVNSTYKFDRKDLNGTWLGDKSSPTYRNFASYDQKIPEPPLTDWGKQHLLYKSISHDALTGSTLR